VNLSPISSLSASANARAELPTVPTQQQETAHMDRPPRTSSPGTRGLTQLAE
jgi:hypothetical protein